MATCTWTSKMTAHWQTLRVQMGDPTFPTTLTGPKKLVELFNWRRGKPTPGVWIVVSAQADRKPRLDEVDWTLFPVAEAQQELMAHEARCALYMPRSAVMS
jgi:hypothetical protein